MYFPYQHANQQTPPHSTFHPPTHRNLHSPPTLPSHSLQYPLSPKDHPHSLHLTTLFTQQPSPAHTFNFSSRSKVSQNMFPPRLPAEMRRIAQQKVVAQDYYSVRKGEKPMIVFSYRRKGSQQLFKSGTEQNSCKTANPLQNNGIVSVGEFEIRTLRREKVVGLCSNVFSHSVAPIHVHKSLKKTSPHSKDIYSRTAQCIQNYFNNSASNFPHKEESEANKVSKIASTQATRSFQAEGDGIEPRTSAYQRQATFNFSSIKQFKTTEKMFSTDKKGLKKTMSFSRCDFGGIIEGERGCVVQEGERLHWKNHVKGLFNGTGDMKQSIHCGPETRAEPLKLNYLTGLGRQIAESCIPDEGIIQ